MKFFSRRYVLQSFGYLAATVLSASGVFVVRSKSTAIRADQRAKGSKFVIVEGWLLSADDLRG